MLEIKSGINWGIEDLCYFDNFVFSNNLCLVILWDCNNYYL